LKRRSEIPDRQCGQVSLASHAEAAMRKARAAGKRARCALWRQSRPGAHGVIGARRATAWSTSRWSAPNSA